MLNDEMQPALAVDIALGMEQDSLFLYGLLLSRVTNRTLRRRYEAIRDDGMRDTRFLTLRAATLDDPAGPPPEAALAARGRIDRSEDSDLRDLGIVALLERIADHHDSMENTCEEMAARVPDGPTKTLLLELSDVEFAHKGMVLTDLQLLRLHTHDR